MPLLFPTMIIIVFTLAGLVNIAYRQWNEAIYSFSAAMLNYAVYFKPFNQ